jgi:hypothetical protein
MIHILLFYSIICGFVNSRSINELVSKGLISEFENLMNVYKSMKKECYRKRPNCENILLKKQFWALDQEKIKDLIKCFNFEKDSLIYRFCKSKIMF